MTIAHCWLSAPALFDAVSLTAADLFESPVGVQVIAPVPSSTFSPSGPAALHVIGRSPIALAA